jgi:hypothetical protein
MTEDFCTRTERKLRRIGQKRKTARHYAGFFYVSMVSVCGALLFSSDKRSVGLEKKSSGFFDLVGDTPCPEGQGEEGPKRPSALPSVQVIPGTGSGIVCSGARAAGVLSASFRIH